RLHSVVLIEPVAFHLLREEATDPTTRQLFHEVKQLACLIMGATVSGDYRNAMARFVDYWNGEGAWTRTKPEVQAALAKRVPKVALDFWATLTESTPLAAYGEIQVPTLVLRGARSPRPTQRIAELVASGLPAGRLQTIAGAGHMLALTHKDVV